MVSFTQPLDFHQKEDPAFGRSFLHDRYDDVPPVCGILWFWLLLRLICHCNRLDLHETFVGVLRFDPRGGSWQFPPGNSCGEIIPKVREMPWKMVSIYGFKDDWFDLFWVSLLNFGGISLVWVVMEGCFWRGMIAVENRVNFEKVCWWVQNATDLKCLENSWNDFPKGISKHELGRVSNWWIPCNPPTMPCKRLVYPLMGVCGGYP